MKRPLLWSSLAFLVLSVLTVGAQSHAVPVSGPIPFDELLSRAQLQPAGDAFALASARTTAPTASASGGSRRGNAFVNDPCLDPAPTEPTGFNMLRTVQSNTDIAVLNSVREDDDDDDDNDHGDDHRRHGDGHDGERESSGLLMVAGYNDSHGQEDNRQGISGFSYSTDGGKQWIDAGGLPPVFPTGLPAGTPGSDAYLGEPSVAVQHRTKKFFYASLYRNAAGGSSVSVNRGQFKVATQQVPVESFANTRCEGNPALHGIPDPPAFTRKRVIWEPPVEAAPPGLGPDEIAGTDDDDHFDKAWLYVNQETGVLYLAYLRILVDFSTPLELVRSFDGGQTWTAPSVIIPNVADTLNQAPRPVVTPTGRVIVAWFARTFDLFTFLEVENRIETAFSDDCGTPAPCTFSAPVIVNRVNPQGKPLGYNREDFTIANLPSITVDKGRDDGIITRDEQRQPGFGNVYITYFDGVTPLPQEIPFDCFQPEDPCNPFARAANILVSRSLNDGASYKHPVKVNDDPGDTSHVFPSVQVNKHGEVFVTWIDRRVDRPRNLLNDTWGSISSNRGAAFSGDGRISTVSTDWYTREDRMPDFGDYNSSEVVRFTDFLSIWADGRFPPPAPITAEEPPFFRSEDESATPDTLTAVIKRNGSIRR